MTTHQEALEAAGEETPAEEFSRLVIEFNEGERQNRDEAWNLIADFACEHSDAIIRGFCSADTITAQAAEIERLKAEADGEFVQAAIRVMQANPGFDARDYSADGITADDFETFFTEDMNEAWNDVEKWKARTEAAEARLSALLDKAVEALEPFARHLDEMKFDLDNNGNLLPDDQAVGWVYVTNGDFRAARSTLAAIQEARHHD